MNRQKYPLGSPSIVLQEPTQFDRKNYNTNEFLGKLAEAYDNRNE